MHPKISDMVQQEDDSLEYIDLEKHTDELEEVPKKKKKLHGLDIYVIFSIAALVIYTIISQVMVVSVGATLDTLTTCFFGFFGGEIVTCALIKIFKLREKKTDEGGGVG